MRKKLIYFVVFILLFGAGVFLFFLFKQPVKIEFAREEFSLENTVKGEKEKENLFNPSELKWKQVFPEKPYWGPRDAHTVVVFKDKIWLFGGVNGGKVKAGHTPYGEMPHQNDVWVSEDGANWQLVLKNAPWGKRRSIAAVVFKDKIWLFGGWDSKTGTKNDVWVSEDGVNWEKIKEKAEWPAREGHSVVVFKDKIWLTAGVDFLKHKTYNDVWYSEDGVNWKEAVSKADWSPRYDQTLEVFKDKMYLIAGLDFGNDVKSDVWVSEDGVNWELTTDSPPWPPRHGHISLVYNKRLWIMGGWDEKDNKGLNDVWYSETGKDWQELKIKKESWLGREDHTGNVFKGAVWIMAGMIDEGEYWVWKNDIWRLGY